MAAGGLDCLVVRGISTKWDSGMANVRYLSQIGGNGEEAIVVFPAEGEPSVLLFAASQLPFWAAAQNWVGDLRLGLGRWASAAAEAVRTAGAHRGRVGVVGLSGRHASGAAVSHDLYAELESDLAEAQLVPASALLEDLRLDKSDEELGHLRRAAKLCAVAFETMRSVAEPGMPARRAYAEIVGSILAAGGEAPVYLLYEAGPSPRHPLRFPPERVLAPGDVVLHELSTKFGGYWSHLASPVFVGEPTPVFRRLEAVARAAYQEVVAAARPGASLGELGAALAGPIESAGFAWSRPRWKGLGLEQIEHPVDAPSERSAGPAGLVLRQGMVFGVQVTVTTADRSRGVMIGDALAITPSGPEQLSGLELETAA